MKRFFQKKWRRGLAAGLILCLVSMVGASLLQTNFGKVELREVHTETSAGVTLSGMLYVPQNATPETPAPAVVVFHGWWKGKEIQSSNAMELARRGYVVFNGDLNTHGDSENVGNDGGEAYTAIQFVKNLPYVNSEKVGGLGHSWGGYVLNQALGWGMERGNEVDLAALMVAGTEPTYFDADGNWADVYGARSVGVIASRYDDFEFHGETGDDGEWEHAPRDYIYSDRAKSFAGFGADPAAFAGEVQPGNYYTQEVDGQKAVRVIYTPTQIHSWNILSPTCVGYAVDFFEETLGAPSPLPASNQLAMVKECFTGLGLIGFVMFLIYFAIGLLDTRYFGVLKAEGAPVQHWPTPKGKGKVWFWGSLALTPLFSVCTIVPIAKYFNPKIISWLPQTQTTVLGLWGALGGVFTLAYLAIFYFCYGRKNGVDLKERGVVLSRQKLWRTILLALLVVLAGYNLVFAADYFFQTDFRFWVVAVKGFTADKLGYGLLLLPFFLVFYVVNSLSVNCFGFNGIGICKKEWGNVALLSFFNAMSAMLFTVVQYVTFFTTGSSAFHATGAEKAVSGWLYAVIVILMVAPIVARKIYKTTRNPYIAGIVNGVIVTFMVSGATSTLTADITGSFPFT